MKVSELVGSLGLANPGLQDPAVHSEAEAEAQVLHCLFLLFSALCAVRRELAARGLESLSEGTKLSSAVPRL